MFMKWSTDVLFMPRRRKWMISAAPLGLILFFVSGCSLLPQEQSVEVIPIVEPPKLSKKPEYNVVKATIEQQVKASGRLLSLQEEQLYYSEDNMRIKDIYVKEGDHVKEGQLIAELETDDLESQIRQKEISLLKDELQLKEDMRKANEQNATQIELSKLDYELQKEGLNKLKVSLRDSQITAPFSGTITEVNKKRGDFSKAYETIATLSDETKLTVAAKLSTGDLESVIVGMEAVVKINNGGTLKGKVARLQKTSSDNQADTIEYFTIIQVDSLPKDAVQGTPLSVSITTEKKHNATLIPPAALRSNGGRNYVQVIEPDGTKREIDVEVGIATSTEVEIVKGIEPGQKVVGK